ncbi:hypothetical protein NW755_002572 [Fusarium falciforme]|uniref:Uncharacterized protein n=1 Tax=Fusarium falciforme TaxID=195108 RepID=A0A9W8V560_9HYPO|nr:hypothetical protein NW755_002572 [Fusarium falciforme]
MMPAVLTAIEIPLPQKTSAISIAMSCAYPSTFVGTQRSEKTEKATPDQDAPMCGYILLVNLCGCYGGFEFDTSCDRIFEELNRINDADAWGSDTINELPFSFPNECVPGWHNTRFIMTYGVCCSQWWSNCPSVTVPGYPCLYCYLEDV